ncbi:hypothetical protein [Sphingomonas sp. SORGH_AS_0438]|uniref:hypothetical protein n=1 Tax=Sphingomonas sp. SORGH_AS_0438 TaxID=3041756 RepID=UPI00285C1518|nr:hypothetical protein [Sphingomonas sp. SORGH_AS_0438]MDR6129089.1 hypothetical protein [Sphingomonas sp. SORGH_AS_0438]
MIRYSIFEIAAEKLTLAGSAMGRQMLASLISETRPVNEPTIAYLDFAGIDIATGSFLREAVLGFRDFSRKAMGALYPVVANANAAIEEELFDYLADHNDAMWACSLDKAGTSSKPHILGLLDTAHRNTLKLICENHRISAPELAKLRPNEGIGVSAWSNRLATLATKGIVMEFRIGKTKLFTPVMEAT